MFHKTLPLKKIIIISLLFIGIGFIPNFCYAFWPADWALNASMTEMLAKMDRQIEGAILASLKQAAIQTINDTVSNAISQGSGSGPMFITDWKDFLYKGPQREADLYMNDFFSSITSGRASISGYSSLGEINYQQSLTNGAKKITIIGNIPKCDITDSSDVFTSNNWNKLNSIFGNDACNQFGFNNISSSEYLSKLSMEQEAALAKSQAYRGFLPKTSGGIIITPGSTIADIQSQVEDIGNKIVAAAQTAPEVVTALVTRLATKTIQQGIGQAQQYAQQKINSEMNSARQKLNASDINVVFTPSY
jgi:hypothetical protein